MRIAVAGGTGTVGRYAVQTAHARGHEVVLLTRGNGVDVLRGSGLEQALVDVDVVIDTLNSTTLSTKQAVEFFETASRQLLAAEKRSGVGHHIALSIVGIDNIDSSYYAGKLAQERLVEASDLPHTIVRTGQFHEFAEQVVRQTTFGPVTLVPRTLTRPVAAREVGARLIDLAEAAPAGRARDLLGPRDESLADMVRRMFAHDGRRRAVLEMRLPGAYGRGLASGELRGGGAKDTTTTTFEQWLHTDHQQR